MGVFHTICSIFARLESQWSVQRLLLSPEFAQAGHLVKSYPESSGKAAGGVVWENPSKQQEPRWRNCQELRRSCQKTKRSETGHSSRIIVIILAKVTRILKSSKLYKWAERNIFGQLVLLSVKHDIDIESTLSFPLSPVPWSLATQDGSTRQHL